jgi:hypothetical protein
VPRYKGKNSHFFLKLKGSGKDLHLKCDNIQEANKWVESLEGLSSWYMGKKIVDWIDERKDYKDEIDVRIVVMIMCEQESKPKPSRRRVFNPRARTETAIDDGRATVRSSFGR